MSCGPSGRSAKRAMLNVQIPRRKMSFCARRRSASEDRPVARSRTGPSPTEGGSRKTAFSVASSSLSIDSRARGPRRPERGRSEAWPAAPPAGRRLIRSIRFGAARSLRRSAERPARAAWAALQLPGRRRDRGDDGARALAANGAGEPRGDRQQAALKASDLGVAFLLTAGAHVGAPLARIRRE